MTYGDPTTGSGYIPAHRSVNLSILVIGDPSEDPYVTVGPVETD